MSFFTLLLVTAVLLVSVSCSSVVATSGKEDGHKHDDKHDDDHHDDCYKLNDIKVRALFNKWNSALKTLSPETVAEQYWEHSILLPTLSAMSRTDVASKLDYFDEFLKKKPSAVIIEDYIVNNCGSSQYRFVSVLD